MGMGMRLLIMAMAVAAAGAVPMSDELFYRAPRLFLMEDYNKCQYLNSTYCKGIFEISYEAGGEKLYQELMAVSEEFHLNRSKLHRAICLSSCGEPALPPPARFERCVDQRLQQHGLRARLQELHYCKSKKEPGVRPRDYLDWLMAAIVAAVLLLNVVGTYYDRKKDPCEKPNKFLMAWSLPSNWQRLTALHGGDQRLDALAPIHGIKAHMILLVILSHTAFALAMVYPYDERTIDKVGNSISSVFGSQGTIVVQTFATISGFLLAYMLLINFEKAKKAPSIKYWPAIVFNRYMRMAPTMMIVVGISATWTAYIAQGPWWHLVEEMEAACRKKWWAHLLFINNFVDPDDRCMLQTWFFAVEMQLFLGAVAVALLLALKPQWALRILGVLYVGALATNFAINISWNMQPVVKFATPDQVRTMAVGVDSYTWMFSATWTSIPSCLHGLILAFTKYHLEKKGFKPEKHKWIGKTTHVMYVCMWAWLLSGELVRRLDSPFWLAVAASLDRTVWNAMITFLLFAYIHGQGGLVVRYLSWRGFQVMGRLVYSAMLLHWHVNLLPVAVSPLTWQFNHLYVGMVYFADAVLSMALAVPLHLLVELPMQKMMS